MKTKEQVYKLDAVLFDFDGVLINTIPFHGRAWAWIMKEQFGISLDDSIGAVTEGLRSEQIIKLILAKAHGIEKTKTKKELQSIIEWKRRYYREIVGPLELDQSIYTMLQKIKQRVRKIGLVTSTNRNNLDHIISESKRSIFDFVSHGETSEKVKPEPDPFLFAARSLNASPERTLVIENSILGIRAARASGMWCAAISSTLAPKLLHEAHILFHSTLEIVETKNWKKMLQLFAERGAPGSLQVKREALLENIRARIKILDN